MSASIPLAARIARLYDDTTQGWVRVWGDHLHHGFYGPDGQGDVDHRQAQIDMVDAVLGWGRAEGDRPVGAVLDAGCGVGGSARHLATALGAEVDGLTLSPVQAGIAKELSGDRPDVRFQVADVVKTPFPDESFDLVWALESAEHFPDKPAFLREAHRLLRPGGRLVGATWCHRMPPPELAPEERTLLDRVSWSYGRSLTWVPASDYRDCLESMGWADIRIEDWSDSVRPFWNAVLKSVLTPQGLSALLRGGLSMLSGAYGGLFMRKGLSKGWVRYVVFTAQKKKP